MSKMLGGIKHRLQHLLAGQGEPVSRRMRLARYHIRLWRFCWRRLRENNAMAMSAALSFRTIFALVPTLVLAFLVLKSFGAFDTGAILRNFFEKAGLSQIVITRRKAPEPSAGTEGDQKGLRQDAGGSDAPTDTVTLADRLEKVIGRVEQKLTLGRIGPVGLLLVIWAAVTLLTTVERSLNRIFRAPRSRSWGRRILLYWSAVTFLPVAIVLADYAAGWLTGVFANVPGVSWLLASVGWVGSVLVGMLLLAAVYKLMPNTEVPFRAALAGAVLALPLWLLAKWGFAAYIGVILENRSLYGALGLIPLFLIWLNLCWLIFLFGAELAHAIGTPGRLRFAAAEEKTVVSSWDLLAAALAVARGYLAGEGPVTVRQVAEKLSAPEQQVRWMLRRLCDGDVLCPVRVRSGEAYVLARPAEKIAVAAILDLSASGDDSAEPAGYDKDISDAIAEIRRRAGAQLQSSTVAELMRGRPAAGG
ncbi:MAG: YhjD/YihY/BrkB family envelope integrity protein [Planctomycetota bacterium]|jgi:membrane protein